MRLTALRYSAALAVLLLLASCGGKKKAAKYNPPPPPPPSQNYPPPQTKTDTTRSAKNTQKTPPAARKPNGNSLFTQEGYASWYGPGFHNRRASNGEVYDMNAMTAAHRDFPLNSVVRVTNEQTGHSAVVRITDRGPFVPNRIIDLSLAAAKQVDVWKSGTAMVKLEVISAPSPVDHGGRWCVQIGALSRQKDAIKLKEHLLESFETTQVIQFPAPDGGYWVRVKVPQDDKKRAQEVARATHVSEGNVFLVRLD
ncbi:rare lipoprotein A [Candidatus Koribacter versatilis Ellin345]|uniref:Probable endolytic peptidoglycan transglycosylase RlpA n=1 Tax=Koribacter versatilis (strain Ellin345) TaxID=204669 RepID=Q1ITK6_KORVE|nr:rare lipoprotein A [Candidatus Koribacter versatilis Ellin345]